MPLYRVRFLLGGRHGEFKFLPPPGYAPCYEAVLPREKLNLEASQNQTAARDLLGPNVTLSQAAFTPTPVDTSQVQTLSAFFLFCFFFINRFIPRLKQLK